MRFHKQSDLSSLFPGVTPPCRGLYVEGELPPARLPRVAIVGSRTPTASGRDTAYAVAHALARAGVVVVSGLARGIDLASHEGALDAGGNTVAFLGAGTDVLYPRSSRQVAKRIPGRGALVSEYSPGTPPLPFRFVERNRLVAAYTRGTLVVEAGEKSGALITAGFALELGRDLWAVPGDPRRPTCRGSNRLLRDGAGVVLEAADLLVALGLGTRGDEEGDAAPVGLSPPEERVWRSLATRGPADAEELSRRTRLPAAQLLEALSLLELAGHVKRDGEGYVLGG